MGQVVGLADITRWIGLAIAIAGALSLNPDASAKVVAGSRQKLTGMVRRARVLVAHIIPFLRPKPRGPRVVSATARSAWDIHGTARALVTWGENATVDTKLDLLDRRTRGHDTAIHQLQQDLKKLGDDTTKRIEGAEARLRKQVESSNAAVWAEIDNLTSMDASALPVIFGGLVVSGLAADAERVPMWTWFLVAVIACSVAAVAVTRIWRKWWHRFKL